MFQPFHRDVLPPVREHPCAPRRLAPDQQSNISALTSRGLACAAFCARSVRGWHQNFYTSIFVEVSAPNENIFPALVTRNRGDPCQMLLSSSSRFRTRSQRRVRHAVRRNRTVPVSRDR